ncbi:hypothetical protein C2E23DRAFT_890790 [Lenzites betulinus]|nr:hypothetical protein C2E23DRAFT_890790 [Lenzites betulinus]
MSKEYLEGLRSRVLTLQLEITVLKAQRATDRCKIERYEHDLLELRTTTQELCAHLRRLSRALEVLEAVQAMRQPELAADVSESAGHARICRMGFPYGIAAVGAATVACWTTSVSWLARNVAMPHADVYVWLAFCLHSLVAVFTTSSAPPNHEYPIWAALDT